MLSHILYHKCSIKMYFTGRVMHIKSEKTEEICRCVCSTCPCQFLACLCRFKRDTLNFSIARRNVDDSESRLDFVIETSWVCVDLC